MILHTITLQNFGIYGREMTFDLRPQSQAQFEQPIILFRGKNGVGKSTLMEAIRLCLHGRLSLGLRTRQREYEAYLRSRLHRDEQGETAVSAHITLTFEHVQLGRRVQYKVRRAWGVNGRRLTTDLHIWVDGELLPDSDDEKEYLLRELVPVGVAELFFFDGEKIATLSEEGASSTDLLADTVKNLLGLHLVEQLDRDLDIYLTRQTGAGELRAFQEELARLHEEEDELSRQRDDIRQQLAECRRRLHGKRETVTLLEEKIAREGGRYAENQANQETERQEIATAIAQVEQEIQELSRGVMPFAVAPNMLRAVQKRLLQEADFARWQASQPVLQEIGAMLGDDDAPEADERIAHVRAFLQQQSVPPMAESDVVHNVSPEKRGVLLNWIDEALATAPRQMAAALRRRSALQEKLQAVEESLSRVPVMEILRPLQEQLRQHEREVGRLEAEQERLAAEEARLTYHLERLQGSKRRVSEQIANINTDEHRIKLAARTKLLLGDYQKRLTERKLAQLAAQMRLRFNQLSRKRNFLERVAIDPETFAITLYRAGKPFPRAQLSAGEKQMFAVATLWALREVSARPLPVIIDTPLSRLDEDHRRAMLAEFMPQVAQQVIVLATTAEIDEETFAWLQPAVSRAYLLQAEKTAVQATELPVARQAPLISLEEVAADAAK
ncbi:MAG: DNA sulfur modification protein DndD [Candidatus Promineifilaceae bacterium]